MMGNTSGNYNEGYAHPDSKHKIVTVIVGFSREWPYERGRLRMLRSENREDCAFEFPPEFGKMCMFRVCDHSYHGFLPQKGQRMSLQLCYVDSEMYVKKEYCATTGARSPSRCRCCARSWITPPPHRRQINESRIERNGGDFPRPF